jgi:hypothetical protein
VRKLSAYARKMRRTGKEVFNGAEFLNAIERCRPYTDEPIIGSKLPGNGIAAKDMRETVRGALEKLLTGEIPPDDTTNYDTLAHAVGVSIVRTHEMGGDKTTALDILGQAKIAMELVLSRWKRLNKWGATRIEQIAIEDAIEVYETILRASSPRQMANATRKRMDILTAHGWVEPGADATNHPAEPNGTTSA